MEVKEKNILYTLKSDLWRLNSKVDRLEGQVQALIEARSSDAKKIEKLETKQRKLDGFRAHMS